MEQYVFAVGSKVKVVSNNFGTRAKIGSIYKITSANGLYPSDTAMTSDYYYGIEVTPKGNVRARSTPLYHGDLLKGCGSRKEMAEFLKEEVTLMKKSIKAKEEEIELLLKYKDEEEELAAKISDILKNKDDVVAIAEILRKHKTDLL